MADDFQNLIDEQLAELRRELAEARAELEKDRSELGLFHRYYGGARELHAERNRLRAALERIATNDSLVAPEWVCDRCKERAAIAREALHEG